MPWWVMKYEDNGRPFMVNYYFPSELRAERYIEDKCGGKGKAFETKSSNKTQAAQEIRQQMSETKGMSGWGRNFKHGVVEEV